MLLYIGNQENSTYLQDVANQLHQPVCSVEAPTEAYMLPELAKPMYTHYVVDVSCYYGNSAALIGALKNLTSRTQGKVMLLAVDMTSQTPAISELIYAGFGDILYCSSDNNGQNSVTYQDYGEVTSVQPSGRKVFEYPSIPTEPLKREAEVSRYGVEESMATEPMGDLPWIVRSPIGVSMGQAGAQSNGKPPEEKSGRSYKKIFVVCGCCLILCVGIIGAAIHIVNKQAVEPIDDMELVQHSAQGLMPVIPVPSTEVSTAEPLKDDPSMVPRESVLPTKAPQVLQVPSATEPPVSEETPMQTPLVTSTSESEPTNIPSSEPTSEPDSTQAPLPEQEQKGVEVGESDAEKKEETKIQKVRIPFAIRIVAGNSVAIEPSYEPSDAKGVKWEWTSTDTGVVEVINGLVTAKKPGNAVITVSAKNGVKASCNVSVAEE